MYGQRRIARAGERELRGVARIEQLAHAEAHAYRSPTLKFKETDNSFSERERERAAQLLQYHIPFLSFHCLGQSPR